jgi:hypothetical protein
MSFKGLDWIQKSKKKAAIAILTTNNAKDVQELCYALRSLRYLADITDTEEDKERREPADVLIFHDGLAYEQQHKLTQCVEGRKVLFPSTDYNFETDFPLGFDSDREQPNWYKREKWGYHQMIRFWITKLWEHPILENYETIMRIDSDSCFQRPLHNEHPLYSNLPGLSSETTVYHANQIAHDEDMVVEGFVQFVVDYVHKNNLPIRNPPLWDVLLSSFHQKKNDTTAPMVGTNLEVVRISWMQSPEVMAWHYAVTEEEPLGVFRNRWGDAIVRFATMAIFAAPEEIEG